MIFFWFVVLEIRMRSHLFRLFRYLFCLIVSQGLFYMSAKARALARLHLCAGSPESLLVDLL